MRIPKVIIVNGPARSGKDTFAKILGELYSVEKLSIIDLSKDIASMIGWDGTKGDRSRRLLSDIKALIDTYNDASFTYLKNKVADIMIADECEYILIDARKIQDIERLMREFDAISVYIKNEQVKCVTTNIDDIDAMFVNPIYTHVIDNNGTIDEFRENIFSLDF